MHRAQMSRLGVAHHQERDHRKAEEHAEEHDLEGRIAPAEVLDDRVMGGVEAEARKAGRTPRCIGVTYQGPGLSSLSAGDLSARSRRGGHRPVTLFARTRVARCTCVHPHPRGRSWCGPRRSCRPSTRSRPRRIPDVAVSGLDPDAARQADADLFPRGRDAARRPSPREASGTGRYAQPWPPTATWTGAGGAKSAMVMGKGAVLETGQAIRVLGQVNVVHRALRFSDDGPRLCRAQPPPASRRWRRPSRRC
jgi:hypothetical protein